MQFSTRLCTWQEAEPSLRAIRTQVFIQEQKVPKDMEWDGEDEHAQHALASTMDNHPIGTARLLLQGGIAHIGRMAVLPEWRGQGVGSTLLALMLGAAQARGATAVFLNAQTSAVGFYVRAGFVAEGEEFLDAGIPHLRMTRRL